MTRRFPKHTTFFAALLAWALLAALAVFIIRSSRDRARLIRDNDNERILNTLFAELRDYDNIGEAVEANETLRNRIAGFAVYDSGRLLLYRWGNVSETFDERPLRGERRFNRYTLPDRRNGLVRFVIHNERPPGSRPRQTENVREGPNGSRRNEGPTGEGPARNRGAWWYPGGGNYICIDIRHPVYWRTITITDILYPLSAVALLLPVFTVRRLYLRTLEYRERIEEQQNLVVLGTAAGTLAHEIKNPLHSIKLQTAILKKQNNTQSTEEIDRIEEEVDRLEKLSYRVNDFLRDAAGNREALDLAAVCNECARRLRGSPLLDDTPVTVVMDGERARSVFENIIRNAMESGSPPGEIRADLRREGGRCVFTLRDRGRGIARENLERVFDPFFTSKSTGTGIGLAISRRFVEAAGGTISARRREGGGAVIRIELPCVS
ncbi:MAG: HAMP domain-containing histidine kinase [Treponema sp.]|nr:HAMP domain-containing histidine kinase [Treponema sp.]